ncbi:FAD-dependent oxidoreductase [Azorhizobium sp. AG788]|uniref:NAD(P)/FAD-dependent oxidoreductase n=1 Tax=Azorhizobium sp. AG788 TaxID=2183897 RepID=UPI0031396D2A
MPVGTPPDLNADVCVVGGTTAGLWTALRLARRGVEVVLLEQGTLAPVHRAGLLSPGLTLWQSTVCGQASKETARATFDLSLEAVADAVAEFEALGIGRTGRGLLRVGAGHETAALDAEAAGRDLLGLSQLRRWGRMEIAATIASNRYAGATYDPHAVIFDTADLTFILAAAARAAGVRILERTPALGADLEGVRKYVHTPAGRVRADHVVLCAGRGAAAIAPWLARALEPEPWVGGGFAVYTARPDFSGLVVEAGPLGARFMPHEGELSFEAPTASRVRGEVGAAVTLRRRARAVYPELGRGLAERAAGFSLSRTPSGLPLIGERRPGVWYAAGLGGNPLANAALAADAITAALVDRNHKIADLSAFQPRYAFGLAGRAASAASFWWLRLREGTAEQMAARAARRAAAEAASPPILPVAAPVNRGRLHGRLKRSDPRHGGAGQGHHAPAGVPVAHLVPDHGPGAVAGGMPGSALLHAAHAEAEAAADGSRVHLHAVT